MTSWASGVQTERLVLWCWALRLLHTWLPSYSWGWWFLGRRVGRRRASLFPSRAWSGSSVHIPWGWMWAGMQRRGLRLGLKAQLHHWLSVWSWPSHSMSLCLCFLIFPEVNVNIKWVNIPKALRIVTWHIGVKAMIIIFICLATWPHCEGGWQRSLTSWLCVHLKA